MSRTEEDAGKQATVNGLSRLRVVHLTKRYHQRSGSDLEAVSDVSFEGHTCLVRLNRRDIAGPPH